LNSQFLYPQVLGIRCDFLVPHHK